MLTGCKEATSEKSPNGGTKPQEVQSEPQTPPDSPPEVEDPNTENAAKPPAVTPVDGKKNLINVIRMARSWGPAREFIPLIGQDAPDFTLTDVNGKQQKLSDHKDKDVILKFWATWCPPCKMTVPHLMELRKTVSEEKLAIIGLSYISSYPPNTEEMIKDFASAKQVNYPIIAVGSEGAGRPYDSVQGLPTIFFIDAEGKIKLATSGLMSFDDLKAVLEAEWPEGAI
jgi:thiol-disulfide isomerase/thioredoxin